MVTSVGSWALECLHTSQLLAWQEASPRREGHAEQFKTQPAFATLGFLQPPFLSHWGTRGSSCPYANTYLGPTKNSGVLSWAYLGQRRKQKRTKVFKQGGFLGVIPNAMSQM